MKQRPRYFIYFHLLLLAGACLRRAVDIRSKNKSEKHKRGGGSDDEGKRGLYIETAEDEGIRKEGEKACSTRVSLIAFISKRGVRPLWYHHGLYSSQKQRQHREHTPGPDLFLSSIILFYFLACPPLLGPQLPFDLSPSPPRRRFIFIYEPMPSTPFYVLHFFLFLFSCASLFLFFNPLLESLSTYRVSRHTPPSFCNRIKATHLLDEFTPRYFSFFN